MTQEKANRIFETNELAENSVISILETTATDGKPFIRYEEAVLHTNKLLNADLENVVDTSITEWYPED
jgi:hypothetical protein